MNKFKWYEAASVEDAIKNTNTTVGEELYTPTGKAAIIKSGGIDVLDMIKEGLIEPEVVVNIKNIPGMSGIKMDDNALHVGANNTLSEVVENQEVKNIYPALYEAIIHAATPQLRNTSTIAGNIAQRTRCWYFRSADHPCLRKGGDRCFARHSETGQNENHSLFENDTCVSVHSSSISTALMAYNAKLVIKTATGKEKEVTMDEFFVTPAEDISQENILKNQEIITSVIIPKPNNNTRVYYHKQVQRESYDWSIGDVAIVAEMDGNKCKSVRMVLGAAAPIPYRVTAVEEYLAGKRINETVAKKAGEISMEAARPLSQNNYKVPLFKNIIRHGLLKLA